MNKVTRVLTMAGMGLIAAVSMAGPAQASGYSDDAPTKKPAPASTGYSHAAPTKKPVMPKSWGRDREWTVDYYRSYRACDFAGRIGERFGKWDDYDCEYQRFGWHRGQFALEVERNWRFGGRPVHFGGRPVHFGGPRR